MPFAVDDFQDLLRLLEQHPEWRAELRRHVLTDELLELPSVVRQLADQMVALTARVDTLADSVQTVVLRMEDLIQAQERAEGQLGKLAGRVGSLDGHVLELRYARRFASYFSRLARTRIRR